MKYVWKKNIRTKIDHLLLNPLTGFPIMFLCFTLLFAASFVLGKPLSNYLGLLLDSLAMAFEGSSLAHIMPSLLTSLIANGVFRGIGSALAFFPQMLIFYIFFTAINDTGYASRISFLMRDPMNRLNMDSNSFTCLLLGYSCNIPAVVSTRNIPNRVDRLVLMLVSTFTPCSARFGVILYIAAAFFTPLTATLVMSGLIVMSWGVSALVAIAVKIHFPRLEEESVRLTLPPLHKPKAAHILRSATLRTLDFLNKIKNVVLVSSVIVWFLSAFPLGQSFDYSYASMIGRFLEPIGHWAGLDWRLIVALFFGFFAKETTLSTLGVLYHASEGLGNLGTILHNHINPLTGLTFLVIYMFYTPCLATVATIRRESGSFWFATLSIFVSLLLALILGTAVYHAGRLLLLLI